MCVAAAEFERPPCFLPLPAVPWWDHRPRSGCPRTTAAESQKTTAAHNPRQVTTATANAGAAPPYLLQTHSSLHALLTLTPHPNRFVCGRARCPQRAAFRELELVGYRPNLTPGIRRHMVVNMPLGLKRR